jgi:pyruvate dehydrogenase E1 component
MGTHQQKKLDDEALKAFRDRFALPLSDEDVTGLKFYRPAEGSPEMRYLHARRERLGGYLPERRTQAKRLPVPARAAFARFLGGSAGREQSTTMLYVQVLSQLLKDPGLGRHIVPIVADEARTFGMQSLFRNVAIYAPHGQLYEPEDREELLYYKEAQDGQILEEGITEAGALASWIAAATSYSTHGVPMLPFYIFYSMFGFQRVGDLIWAAADSRSRGFLVGATAGRTTLAGEGLQHQDGSSHLAAATIPNCVAYDPCYGYELALILQDGARRMLEADEDVFYYVTVMNENYAHPAMPAGAEEGVLKGMHRVREAGKGKNSVRLLGAGAILREALAAADALEAEHGVAAEVWSVTSFTELRRDGRASKKAWVAQCLEGGKGPVIAASDYVSALADLIREWVPGKYVTLGTDGVGRSDTRAALRAHFGVDRAGIVKAALDALG